jgi:predicted small metal-binding protein
MDRITVRCACGWEWSGDVEAVVAATQDHGRRVHNMSATRDEVLAMARPPEDANAPAAGSSSPSTD